MELRNINYRGIAAILLIIYTTLIISPLANENISVNLDPLHEEEIVIHIYQPNLKIIVQNNVNIVFNMSKLSDNTVKTITSNKTLNSDFTINNLDAGLYRIQLISDTLTTVEFDSNGVNLSELVIFILLVLINLINLYYYLEEY